MGNNNSNKKKSSRLSPSPPLSKVMITLDSSSSNSSNEDDVVTRSDPQFSSLSNDSNSNKGPFSAKKSISQATLPTRASSNTVSSGDKGNGSTLSKNTNSQLVGVDRYATLSVHPLNGGNRRHNDPVTGAVTVPISLATTFEQDSPGHPRAAGFEYARSNNPTRQALEQSLAGLEQGADWSLTFASGSAVLTTMIHLFPTNGHVICMDDVYGGTHRYLSQVIGTSYEHQVSYIDMSADNVDKCLRDAFQAGKTFMVWVETPTNPTMKLANISLIAQTLDQLRAQHKESYGHLKLPGLNVGASLNPVMMWPLLIVDNTFLSPVFQSPLLLGADLVTHSISKYINGHSDVIMGTVMGSDYPPRQRGIPWQSKIQLFYSYVKDRLSYLQNAVGAVPSPFDCYLVMRGMKTLYLRMMQHAKSAAIIAEELAKHPMVGKIYYPGHPSHPQYNLAMKQHHGHHGGMLSFVIRESAIIDNPNEKHDDSDDELANNKLLGAATRFCTNLKLFTLAESLGGYESLIEIPAIMTHASVDLKSRTLLGITDGFIRLSIGIERTEDLVQDLRQALDRINGQQK